MNILQNEFDISIENYLEITNLNNLKKDTEFFINTSESFLNNLNEIRGVSFSLSTLHNKYVTMKPATIIIPISSKASFIYFPLPVL